MTIVAIIGPDGCGKTTQARILVEMLKKNGHDTLYVHIYDVLSNATTPLKKVGLNRIGPRTFRGSQLNSHGKSSMRKLLTRLPVGVLGFLYALATYIYIRMILGRNRMVVCDRYFYQFFFDLFGNYGEKVVRIFPKPDITFLLEGDLDLFYSRMIDSVDRSINRDYYKGVIKLFNKLAEDLNFVKIDTTLDKEAVNDLIFKYLVNNLKEIYHE